MTDSSWLGFHRSLSRLIAGANDAHFHLGESDDPFLSGFYDDSFKTIPLDLYIPGGKVYVRGCYSEDTTLHEGDQILAIDDRPINDIVQELKTFRDSDGNIETYIIKDMETQFRSWYFWYIDQPDSFSIQYIPLKNPIR